MLKGYTGLTPGGWSPRSWAVSCQVVIHKSAGCECEWMKKVRFPSQSVELHQSCFSLITHRVMGCVYSWCCSTWRPGSCLSPRHGGLARNTKKCISDTQHKAWLHHSAGESRGSGRGHVNMLNLRVDLRKSPLCLLPLVLLPDEWAQPCSLERGWGPAEENHGGCSRWTGLLRFSQRHRMRHSPNFEVSLPAQKWTRPCDSSYKKAGEGYPGCAGLPRDRRGWSSPIARWALSRFAPFFAALLA